MVSSRTASSLALVLSACALGVSLMRGPSQTSPDVLQDPLQAQGAAPALDPSDLQEPGGPGLAASHAESAETGERSSVLAEERHGTEAWVERMKDLERRLSLLESSRVPAQSLEDRYRIPMEDPVRAVDAMNKMAQRLRVTAEPGEFEELLRSRIEFIETYPDHGLAADQLISLTRDAVLAGDVDEGLARLSQHAAEVGLNPTIQTRERAGLLFAGRRLDEAGEEYSRLSMDPLAEEHVQAEGAFWAAFVDQQAGRQDKARLGFEELVRRFDGTTSAAVQRTISGAMRQLEGPSESQDGS